MKKIITCIKVLGITSIIVMCILTLFQVFMRFVLNNPLAWPAEISQYLMIISIFIGLGLMETENSYIKVDVITKMLPQKMQRGINIISKILLLGLAVCLINGQRLLYQMLIYASTPASDIPLIYFHVPIFIGIVLWGYIIFKKLMNREELIR